MQASHNAIQMQYAPGTVRRTCNDRIATVYLASAEQAPGVDGRAIVPVWQHHIQSLIERGYLHGQTMRQTYYCGGLFETATITYERGLKHGEGHRVTNCASPSGTYKWRLTEDTQWERGVLMKTTPGFKCLGPA